MDWVLVYLVIAYIGNYFIVRVMPTNKPVVMLIMWLVSPLSFFIALLCGWLKLLDGELKLTWLDNIIRAFFGVSSDQHETNDPEPGN